ncbi:MAG: sulfurtransferase complex subunit TusB [Gallionella sp.]|jgi:tRNA 2-thiouridine synthesizing protein B|uniref:Sulfite reductase, dissimilatory-type, subunit DsrH n=1 Tax=Candidatus Gallionella acididurans TaxID=1796491 RepID=A0A139BVV1_9PROT|nr:MAG: Sulfite reductase, dissimilatory-type, subunit DsrH [Candidatus Gallionella acididurans]
MLHIINKSPLTNCALDSCLRVVQSGDILLIEDAVYAATSGNVFEDKIREAMGRCKVYVLQPDLDARGFGDRIIDGVSPVDYGGFVDLTTTNKNCQSWL